MAKQQWWAVEEPGKDHPHQVLTDGRAPSETGDNPAGWPEHKIKAPGDPLHEQFDRKTKRWRHHPERSAASHRAAELAAMSEEDRINHLIDERLRFHGLIA